MATGCTWWGLHSMWPRLAEASKYKSFKRFLVSAILTTTAQTEQQISYYGHLYYLILRWRSVNEGFIALWRYLPLTSDELFWYFLQSISIVTEVNQALDHFTYTEWLRKSFSNFSLRFIRTASINLPVTIDIYRSFFSCWVVAATIFGLNIISNRKLNTKAYFIVRFKA